MQRCFLPLFLSLAIGPPRVQATTASLLQDRLFIVTENDATLNCRPSDGAEMTRDLTSRSMVDCCGYCANMANCEMVAFSEQKGVCLAYREYHSLDVCDAMAGWKVATKRDTNYTAPACLNGGSWQADSDSCQCYDGYVGDMCERVMEDCYEGKLSGHYASIGSGNQKVLWAQPRLMEQPVQVTCLESGMTLFQRRQSPDVNFNRTWQEYVSGFGQARDSFWMGLQNLHLFTNSKQYDLELYFFTASDERKRLTYKDFIVAGDAAYTVSLGPFLEGDLADHLHNMSGQPFSTYDNDNDNAADSNCGQRFGGGWWFDACADYNFNGRLDKTGVLSGLEDQVYYKGLVNQTFTAMSLRLKNPGI